MEYKNALILSLGKTRPPKAYEPHWDKKHTRPTDHSATCKELQRDTHLDESTVVETLNQLEAEGKVISVFKGGKECLILWWELA